jgi:hypothetical protein
MNGAAHMTSESADYDVLELFQVLVRLFFELGL